MNDELTGVDDMGMGKVKISQKQRVDILVPSLSLPILATKEKGQECQLADCYPDFASYCLDIEEKSKESTRRTSQVYPCDLSCCGSCSMAE